MVRWLSTGTVMTHNGTFYQNYHKLRYRNLSTTQSTTDLELLISLARLLNQKVTHLDYTSYLQSHLNTVICELERQQTLRESADLRFIQENNGGHIRKDLDSLGERMFPLGYETTTDNYEHSSYYWDTDRNKWRSVNLCDVSFIIYKTMLWFTNSSK